jgi:hypothetical protein
MVKRTRFDPLHDAATEQQLFDTLPSIAKELAATGDAIASVTQGTERFEVALTRDQFAQTADPVYRGIVGLLHQLRPAGASVAIVVPQPVIDLPGFRETLEPFVGCELITIPDGFAAAATSVLDLPAESAEAANSANNEAPQTVRLLRRLSLNPPRANADPPHPSADPPHPSTDSPHPSSDAAPPLTPAVSREFLGKRRSTGALPSHVLFDGRAYALTGAALVVGRNTASTPYRALTLSDGLAGVSRRHCTFVHDGEDLVLLDHSTFGTFVNGERVQERVRVHAGDRVRLGEPGVELSLIAVGDPTATT